MNCGSPPAVHLLLLQNAILTSRSPASRTYLCLSSSPATATAEESNLRCKTIYALVVPCVRLEAVVYE
eukprot:25022-Eustigmatos_ZCMA.PRE.1